MSEVINVSLSKDTKQTCLNEGFNPELDRLKAQWDHLEDILQEAARATLDDFPLLASVRAEFVGHIGYHIAVRKQDQQYATEINGGLEFMFEQDDCLLQK